MLKIGFIIFSIILTGCAFNPPKTEEEYYARKYRQEQLQSFFSSFNNAVEAAHPTKQEIYIHHSYDGPYLYRFGR